MQPDDVKTQTRAFISKFFQSQNLNDDDDIFALGFVNSLFAMQLVMFVEKTFDMTVEDDDLHIDNFRTINTITNLVMSKVA